MNHEYRVDYDVVKRACDDIAFEMDLPMDRFAVRTRDNYIKAIYNSCYQCVTPYNEMAYKWVNSTINGNLASWYANEYSIYKNAPMEWQKSAKETIVEMFKEAYPEREDLKEDYEEYGLPTSFSVLLSDAEKAEMVDSEDEEEFVSDYITNKYGFCHNGFTYEIVGDELIVSNVQWDVDDEDALEEDTQSNDEVTLQDCIEIGNRLEGSYIYPSEDRTIEASHRKDRKEFIEFIYNKCKKAKIDNIEKIADDANDQWSRIRTGNGRSTPADWRRSVVAEIVGLFKEQDDGHIDENLTKASVDGDDLMKEVYDFIISESNEDRLVPFDVVRSMMNERGLRLEDYFNDLLIRDGQEGLLLKTIDGDQYIGPVSLLDKRSDEVAIVKKEEQKLEKSVNRLQDKIDGEIAAERKWLEDATCGDIDELVDNVKYIYVEAPRARKYQPLIRKLFGQDAEKVHITNSDNPNAKWSISADIYIKDVDKLPAALKSKVNSNGTISSIGLAVELYRAGAKLSGGTGVKESFGAHLLKEAKDPVQRRYKSMSKAKWASLGETMTLKDALDLWWNSVRIDGEIYYKTYIGNYETPEDDIPEELLNRKITLWNEYDNDSDGYPIVYADWSEELKEAKDIKDKMYVGIWDDAQGDFVEYKEFDDFQDALEFASKYDYSKIKSGTVKFDTNSLFTKGFASEFDIVDGKTDLKAMQELMPKKEEKLIQSSSYKSFQQNIETEIKAGKPRKQAVAIAYDVKRKNEGVTNDEWAIIKTNDYYDPEGLDIKNKGDIIFRGDSYSCKDEFDEMVDEFKYKAQKERLSAQRGNHRPSIMIEKSTDDLLVIYYPNAQSKEYYQLVNIGGNSTNESYEDDYYDDYEQAGIYGGDLTYCPLCDRKLVRDEDGDSYCPNCKDDAHSLSMKRRHLMKESKVSPLDRAVEIYTTVLDPYGNLNSPFGNEEDYIEDLKDSFKNKQYAEYFISEYEDDDDAKAQEFVSLLKNIHSIKEAVDPTKAKEVKKNSDALAVLYGYKFRNEPEVELEPEEHDEKSLRVRINQIVSSYNGKGNRPSKNAKETDFIFYVLYR